MFFRKYLLALAFLLISFSSFSQYYENERTQGRGVYLELLGNGLTYSFNYDQRFSQSLDGLGFKAGFSYISLDGSSLSTIPFGLNYLLGKNGKYFETGIGATYLVAADNSYSFGPRNNGVVGDGLIGNLIFGYRSEPVDGGFLFRATVTPMFGAGFFFPFYGGISLGYAF